MIGEQIAGYCSFNKSDLAQIVGSHKPGYILTLTVLRGNKQHTLSLTLGKQ
jgi:S1-C subfamily serine protease